jgi:formylglycine-generating enzyme required for sulfatase activity
MTSVTQSSLARPSVCRALSLSSLVITFWLAISPAAAWNQIDRKLTHPKQTVNQWPIKSKRFALVIGVDKYQDPQIHTLQGASNDAKILSDAMVEYAGFPRDQVVLLTSDQDQDHLSNRNKILRRLSNIRQAVPKDGLLLLSFAGNGIDRYLLPMVRHVQNKVPAQVQDLGGGVTLEMVKIPPGTFLMGTSQDDVKQVTERYQGPFTKEEERVRVTRWLSRETPQHTVTVSPFFMGKFEVTQAQWRAVARLPKVDLELNPGPSYFKGDTLPVEQVSWDDAMEFCARLSRATGRAYRLPSEAEWEYACRAGSATQFNFGDTITAALVNYNGRFPYGSDPNGEHRDKTWPVGSSGVANAFGLYDMHGNVWEWCLDSWHKNYSSAPMNGQVWEGGDKTFRAMRGGSWYNTAVLNRSASRNPVPHVARSYVFGFRVVVGE